MNCEGERVRVERVGARLEAYISNGVTEQAWVRILWVVMAYIHRIDICVALPLARTLRCCSRMPACDGKMCTGKSVAHIENQQHSNRLSLTCVCVYVGIWYIKIYNESKL